MKLSQHFPVIVQCIAVDGEHPAGLAHAHRIDPGEHIVDVSGQGGDVGDLGNVGLPVQDSLIQMGNTPPLRDVEAKHGGELLRRRPGDGVLPGTEGDQQVPIFVEGQIAVHHGRYAHGAHVFPVFNAGQRRLQPRPYLVQGIGPHAVFKAAGPGVVPGGYGRMTPVNGHCLDPGGAQLNAKTDISHSRQPQGFSVG